MNDFETELGLSDLFGKADEYDDPQREIKADESFYLWKTRVWDKLGRIDYKKYMEELDKYAMPRYVSGFSVDIQELIETLTVRGAYRERVVSIIGILSRNFSGKKRALESMRGILYSKSEGKTVKDKDGCVATLLAEYEIELGDAEDAYEEAKRRLDQLDDVAMQLSRIVKLLTTPTTGLLLRGGEVIPEDPATGDPITDDLGEVTPWTAVKKASRKI